MTWLLNELAKLDPEAFDALRLTAYRLWLAALQRKADRCYMSVDGT